MTWSDWFLDKSISVYALKAWQPLIGAVIGSLGGFVLLIIGAFIKFWLDRRRDDQLRQEEAKSVMAALYGEILLLRNEIGDLARIVGLYEIQNKRGSYQNKQFVTFYALSEPVLYKHLASKFGLINTDLVISIVEFYRNYEEAKRILPQLSEKYRMRMMDGRTIKTEYEPSIILKPCCDAVELVEPTLRKIEKELCLTSASDVDLGHAHLFLENEEN